MMHRALIAGSFDPVTVGHLDMIRRTANFFDTVTVCVFCNHEKSDFILTPAQRAALLRAACASVSNVKVDHSDGYVADYVAEHGICAIVKGLRGEEDLPYELLQANFNRRRCPKAETLLLTSSPELEQVSATEVRRRIYAGEDYEELIPAETRAMLREFLATR